MLKLRRIINIILLTLAMNSPLFGLYFGFSPALKVLLFLVGLYRHSAYQYLPGPCEQQRISPAVNQTGA